jgi:hypothetical protein
MPGAPVSCPTPCGFCAGQRAGIEQVAVHLEYSDSKIARIEGGQTRVTPRDIRDMLDFYGVNGTKAAELIELARKLRAAR